MRAVIVSLIVFCGAVLGQATAAQNREGHRFAAVDVYLDSAEPVAAWQFEFSKPGGEMKIVGVENGDSAAFERAPYYDREAVQLGAVDRIVVADFSLADASLLPSGRTRIATLHLMLAGTDDDPVFGLNLVTAVTHDGEPIDAKISFETSAGSEQ